MPHAESAPIGAPCWVDLLQPADAAPCGRPTQASDSTGAAFKLLAGM